MSPRRRKAKGVVAAGTGFATGARGPTAQDEHSAVKAEILAAEKEGLHDRVARDPPDEIAAKELRERIRAAKDKGQRAARERQSKGRRIGSESNAAEATKRHAEWQRRAEEVWQKNPTRSRAFVAQRIADDCGASERAVREVIRKP